MTSCPLCGSTEIRLFKRGKALAAQPFSITQPTYGYQRTLCLCHSCEGVFADPLPTQASLDHAYETLEDSFYVKEGGRARNAREVLLSLEKIAGHRGRLLDVGCFCGTLLSEAKRLGWETEGVEPSRWARGEARRRFGIEIRFSSVEAASFPEGTFDAATAIDVLEHFLHPREALVEIRRILKPRGLFYLTTPDIQSLASRIFQGRWWGYRPEHLFYFSRQSLRALLVSVGFEPVWEGCASRFFTLRELARRLKGVSPPLARLLSPVGRIPLLEKREFRIHLFDQIALMVKKPNG